MKTAIQIAIENIEQCLNKEDTRDMLINLLELEKEQIIDAYEAAMERPIDNYAEAYYNMNYNQTYNQNK